MAWQVMFFVIPLLLATAVTALLALHIWRLGRHEASSRIGSILLLAVCVWLFFGALEMVTIDISVKMFWRKVKYFGIFSLPTLWLLYTLSYTGREKWISRRNLLLLSLIPLSTLVLVFTNDFHGLIWPNVVLHREGMFPIFVAERGVWLWIFSVYSYLQAVVGSLILLQMLFHQRRLFRRNINLLIFAVTLVLLANFLERIGFNFIVGLDLEAFALAIIALPLGWALLRWRLGDIVPVAHEIVIQRMNDPVIILDSQDRILELNRTAEDLFHHDGAKVIGQTIKEILPKLHAHVESLSKGKDLATEFVFTREDAQWFYDVRISPLIDKTGRIITKVIVMRDISDRKGAEAALQRAYDALEEKIAEATKGLVQEILERKQAEAENIDAKEEIETIWGSVTDGIALVDLDGNIVRINKRMVEIGGYTEDETIGKTFKYLLERFAPQGIEKTLSSFAKVLSGKQLVPFEMEAYTKQGKKLKVEISGALIKRKGEVAGVLVDIRDVTKQKQLEAQLKQAQKMESIGILSGGIAHDFNNILGIIIGSTELALEEIPDWNPAHTNLEEIKTAGLMAAGVVRRLLRFSRKTDQELKPIDAITVIKDALKLIRSMIPSTIDIRKHLPNKDITILSDPIQINQILVNICINSSQAMEETGGIMEIKVENESLTEDSIGNYPDLTAGDYLKIVVSDTGPGIESKVIDQIFVPYFTTKEIGKGSGMGLAVVHGIVKNNGGAITVDSNLGKGTTFNILLPVSMEKPEVAIETTEELPLGNESILFVDDEKLIVDVTGQILKRLGYQVESRLNPVEALDLFQSKPDKFDLVITDMTMPQMTGVKLSEKMMEIRSDIPVIICTGHSSIIDEEKAKKLGIAAYAMKPIVMAGLAKTVRNVLDKAKAQVEGPSLIY